MELIVLQRITAQPEQVLLCPDYLIGLLLQHGRGSLQADADGEDGPIGIRLVSPKAGVNEPVCQQPRFLFRPLACGILTVSGQYQQIGILDETLPVLP